MTSITDASSGPPPPSWSDFPVWGSILEYLLDDPMMLLRCMKVNKKLRKEAGQLMNLRDSGALFLRVPTAATVTTTTMESKLSMYKSLGLTMAQKMNFLSFLNNPSSFSVASENSIMGPYRPEKIRELREVLEETIVILKVSSLETTELAIMDSGKLVATCKIKTISDTNVRCTNPRRRPWHIMIVFTSTSYTDPWKRGCVVLSSECTGKGDSFWSYQFLSLAITNCKLFRLCQGRLSPIEMFAVLMHAATSKAEILVECAANVNSHLPRCLVPDEEDTEKIKLYISRTGGMEGNELEDWMEDFLSLGRELQAIQYE